MSKNRTFFDWEDEFGVLENIKADIFVNETLKMNDIQFDKIEIHRGDSGLLNLSFHTQTPIHSNLLKNETKVHNLKIELKLKSFPPVNYDSIVFSGARFVGETQFYFKEYVETRLTANKIVYSSKKETLILKEWYGCNNKLNFYDGLSTSKTIEETITYKNRNRVSFRIKNKFANHSLNSFWVKLNDYKFKVSILKDTNKENEYVKYSLEYRKAWGLVPDEETRDDISAFLSFVIGTKLVKFGETHFDDNYISQKNYIAPSPINISLLYQPGIPFYCDDYRHSDTDVVIKQISKMLHKYFLLKEKYRLNEVLAALYVQSYLNFNFINYVTYIEMFANVDVGQKPTIISKTKFKEILKKLNQTKRIPKGIKDKFQNLNTIGIGKKVQRLLSKYKIDYSTHKDVFYIRGKVVHGARVDIKEMYMASEKAKELLTILTLKKLNYNGYIRNFTNNDELILLKDMSRLII